MGGSCANRRDAAALACVCRAAAAAAPTSKWRSAVRISPNGFVLEPADGTFDVTVAPGEDMQAAVDRCPPGGCVLLLPGTHEGRIVLQPADALEDDDADVDAILAAFHDEESDSDSGSDNSSQGGGEGSDGSGSYSIDSSLMDSISSGGGSDLDDGKEVHVFGRGRATLVYRGRAPVLSTAPSFWGSTFDGLVIRRLGPPEPGAPDAANVSAVCIAGDFTRLQFCDVVRYF